MVETQCLETHVDFRLTSSCPVDQTSVFLPGIIFAMQILRDAADKLNAFKAQLDCQQNDMKVAEALKVHHQTTFAPVSSAPVAQKVSHGEDSKYAHDEDQVKQVHIAFTSQAQRLVRVCFPSKQRRSMRRKREKRLPSLLSTNRK